jgi:CHASE2 domain-containing sensor protein
VAAEILAPTLMSPAHRSTWVTAGLLLVVALAAAGLGVLSRAEHLLRRPEQQTVDARFQIRGSDRDKAKDIVLVQVDDATFNAFRDRGLRAQWPFPRRYHARVIDRLRRAGAKVIAFDVQFTEQTTPTDDNALISAVGRAGNVVLSTTDVGPGGSTNVLGGDDVLRQLGARAGNTSVRFDSDGVLRSTQYEIDGLKTFGVALAEAASHHAVPASSFGGARHPVPIDWAGPPGTVRAISYARVYDGRFPPGLFAGKIVIVGTSAPSLQDLHQTPTSGSAPMAGPEILANATQTVLRGIALRAPPDWVTVLLIGLLAVLGAIAGLRLGTLGVAIAGAAVLALWSLAAQPAFDAGTVLDYSDAAAALVLGTGGAVLVGLWADSCERRRLRTLFAAAQAGVVEDVLHPSGSRALEPTAIIAGYRIEEAIGRGGMGVVYRATQLALDRPVALKLIAAERAQDPVFRARFELESRLAASIEHVNVIPVYEAGEDDGLLFIAMRLVDGIDLAQLLGEVGALEPPRAVRLIAQLAGALDAAHAHGLVHRDVKPANVLLTRDEPEHAYLTDFGVAKYVRSQGGVTVAGQLVGTLDYAAPEQFGGGTVDGRTDVYALAGLLYHCLTGEPPFPRADETAKLWAHVNAAPPAPTRLRPGLSEAIDEVIARGMAKDPAARYATAAELARAAAHPLGVQAPAAALSSVRRPTSGHVAPTVVLD